MALSILPTEGYSIHDLAAKAREWWRARNAVLKSPPNDADMRSKLDRLSDAESSLAEWCRFTTPATEPTRTADSK